MILSCQNICKSFGEKVILEDASFHIEDREKAALIGNNGAGKTTLLRIIMHEISPDSGNVVLAKDKNIGYLAQYQDIHGHHFGKGNTKPVFAQKGLRVLDSSILGKNKNVVKVKLLDPQGVPMEGIYFGEAEEFAGFLKEHDTIAVTYYPEINRFRGKESLQIIIQNYC